MEFRSERPCYFGNAARTETGFLVNNLLLPATETQIEMSDIVTVLAPVGPVSLSALKDWIGAGFAAFDLPQPSMRSEGEKGALDADQGSVIVEGFGAMDECRISVARNHSETQIGIETDMGWQLVALVAYGLCNRSGGTLRNEANQFDRQPTYTAETLRRYIVEDTSLTRAGALSSLREEVESLAQGMNHPDTVAWLFIRHITRLQDPSLMDLAPTDVRDKIRTVISEFERDGEYVVYSRRGPIDQSRAVRELARLLAVRQG